MDVPSSAPQWHSWLTTMPCKTSMFNPFPLPFGYVYYADDRALHVLCMIEAASQEVAKQLVRESVPNEYCETVVDRWREP